MTIECPSCQHQLSTEASMPKFCSNCGASLVDLVAGLQASGMESPDHQTQPGIAPDVTAPFSKAGTMGRTQRGSTGRSDSPGDDPAPQLSAGSEVGPYRIDHLVGTGGMGSVYQATHCHSGQTVALKLLSKPMRTTDETVQRFQRESQIAASINHPRSTFVYGAAQHEGQFYITMELMTGGTLDDVVKRDGPLEVGYAVDCVLDIIDGLRAAHEAGIVHRDLKPSNCFLDHDGRVKIGDFGLARSFVSDSSLTQTGAFMGTPQFAAPEQLRTSDVDERADIYAIGGTLFYLLAGRPPFVGNAAQVISSIASETPPRVSTLADQVPVKLCRVIHQTLEKNPDRRPENLGELRQLLLPFSTRGATAADPGRRMAAFFVDSILIGFVNVMLSYISGVFFQLMPTSIDSIFLANIVVNVAVGVIYFAFLEFWFGTTLGKWLFGMRVTTMQNRPPGLVQSMVRALIMPGIMSVAHHLPSYIFGVPQPDELGWMAAAMLLFQSAGWILAGLCFVTARKSNSFRGLHELASDTRVVRLSGELEYQRPSNVPVTVPVTASLLNTIRADDVSGDTQDYVAPPPSGEFRVIGELGRYGDLASLYLGRDEALEREVWIVNSSSETLGVSGRRKSVSRPTRLRILGEHQETGGASVIMEAAKGLPLVEFVRLTPSLDWRSFRPLVQELVVELDQAQSDDTLPDSLCLAQVWVDEGGHARLLDQPVLRVEGLPAGDGVVGYRESDFVKHDPLDFIKALLDVFVDNQVVPAHVLTFQEEIDVLAGEPEPLRRLAQRLGELADIPSAWRWDDRAGVLAVTLGLEMSIASSVIMALVLLIATLNAGAIASAIFALLATSALAVGLGWLFLGGPVFHLSGVLVRRNRTLQPATPLRCAVRNWVAWLPVILSVTIFGFVLGEQMVQIESNSTLQNNLSLVSLIGLIALMPLALSAIAGGVYSIFRPPRGLQDLICGTRLIRK